MVVNHPFIEALFLGGWGGLGGVALNSYETSDSSSHNHGSGEWVHPRLVSFALGAIFHFHDCGRKGYLEVQDT